MGARWAEPRSGDTQSRGLRARTHWRWATLRQRERWPPCSWDSSSWTWQAGRAVCELPQQPPHTHSWAPCSLLTRSSTGTQTVARRWQQQHPGAPGSPQPHPRRPTARSHSAPGFPPQPPMAALRRGHANKPAAQETGSEDPCTAQGGQVSAPLPDGHSPVATSWPMLECGALGLGEGAPEILPSSARCALLSPALPLAQ